MIRYDTIRWPPNITLIQNKNYIIKIWIKEELVDWGLGWEKKTLKHICLNV